MCRQSAFPIKVMRPVRMMLRTIIPALVLCASVLAQESAPAKPPLTDTATVTVAATAERVRFTAPNVVVQMRLEVYDEAGRKLLDTEQRGGAVLDWHLQSGAGERVAEGGYLCVLTVKSLSGRLSQRLGTVTVGSATSTMQSITVAELKGAQAEAVGPVEGNTALVILPADWDESATVITHDGREGHLSRTRGALTFRVGDFFFGRDKEQMRLTEEGNLGIGTPEPQAKLDVAGDVHASGTIGASKGIEFADGTVQTSGLSGRKDANGNVVPNASGTGTQNKIAKWTDNAGTLGDSTIFEDAGNNIGIGTTTPNPNAVLHLHKTQSIGTAMFVTNSGAGTALASLRAGLTPADFAVDYASLNILGAAWPTGVGGVFLKPKTVLMEGSGSNFGVGNINPTEPVLFYTTPQRLERMRLTATGNVGIGTTNPQSLLDVAGAINTSTQYNIGGLRLLSTVGTQNFYAGVGAGPANVNPNACCNSFFGPLTGTANTTGSRNAFFGAQVGSGNTSGAGNSFFGMQAGNQNISGSNNSFFGVFAGLGNTTGTANSFFGANAGNASNGNDNSFFGDLAGSANTSASKNSFFGSQAGFSNTAGINNSFFGYQAGKANSDSAAMNNSFFGTLAGTANVSGSDNSFFGEGAGVTNTTGSLNSALGFHADLADGLTNATAIGFRSFVEQSNSLVLGAVNGKNSATVNTNVGIGTTAPNARLHIVANSGQILMGDAGCNPGFVGIGFATALSGCDNYSLLGDATSTVLNAPSGGTLSLRVNNSNVLTMDSNNDIHLRGNLIGLGPERALCLGFDASKLQQCGSSSIRYKKNVTPLGGGLSVVKRLQPVSYNWKTDNTPDLGLIAEEVAAVEPFLVTHDKQGQIQGVRYERIGVVLIGAVKEQQQQIEQQQAQIHQQQIQAKQQQARLARQQGEIDTLKRLICAGHPRAGTCKRLHVNKGFK